MAKRSVAAKSAQQKRQAQGSDGEIVLLTWIDYVGLARCRGVPLAAFELAPRLRVGLGGRRTGADALRGYRRQSLGPDDGSAPDAGRGNRDAHRDLGRCAGLSLRAVRFRCSTARTGNAACAASSRRRWRDLEAETGLQFAAAFEHEFLLSGNDLPWIVPFSVEQMRICCAVHRRSHARAASPPMSASRRSSRNMASRSMRSPARRPSDLRAPIAR